MSKMSNADRSKDAFARRLMKYFFKKVPGGYEPMELTKEGEIAQAAAFCKSCIRDGVCEEKKCEECEWGQGFRDDCVKYSINEPFFMKLGGTKPFILKGPNTKAAPRINLSRTEYTENDLDFMVKSKAHCDYYQNEGYCEPGPECLECKYYAGVQAIEDYDPLAQARLQDAADSMRYEFEAQDEREKEKKKKNTVSWTMIWIEVALILLSILIGICSGGDDSVVLVALVFFGLAIVGGFVGMIVTH